MVEDVPDVIKSLTDHSGVRTLLLGVQGTDNIRHAHLLGRTPRDHEPSAPGLELVQV